jgi:hypothetical protein
MLTEDCTNKNISNIQCHNKKMTKPKVATTSFSVMSVFAKSRVWQK